MKGTNASFFILMQLTISERVLRGAARRARLSTLCHSIPYEDLVQEGALGVLNHKREWEPGTATREKYEFFIAYYAMLDYGRKDIRLRRKMRYRDDLEPESRDAPYEETLAYLEKHMDPLDYDIMRAIVVGTGIQRDYGRLHEIAKSNVSKRLSGAKERARSILTMEE